MEHLPFYVACIRGHVVYIQLHVIRYVSSLRRELSYTVLFTTVLKDFHHLEDEVNRIAPIPHKDPRFHNLHQGNVPGIHRGDREDKSDDSAAQDTPG